MTNPSRPRSSFALILALAGTLALALSFAWPAIDDGRSAWTEEQAERSNEIAQKIHTLGFRGPDAVEEDPAEIEAELQRLDTELSEAQNRPRRISRWLGVAAIVSIGGAWWLGRGESAAGPQSGGQR